MTKIKKTVYYKYFLRVIKTYYIICFLFFTNNRLDRRLVIELLKKYNILTTYKNALLLTPMHALRGQGNLMRL